MSIFWLCSVRKELNFYIISNIFSAWIVSLNFCRKNLNYLVRLRLTIMRCHKCNVSDHYTFSNIKNKQTILYKYKQYY